MKKLISFDTETTGLVVNRLRSMDKQPAITEIYMERVNTATEERLEEFHSWFKPPVRLEAEAAKVTGLTEAFLSDKPTFDTKLDEIQSFFDDCEIILGQNVTFDITMLEIEFKRYGRVFNYSGKRLIDTIEQTSYIFGFRSKLSDIYEYLFGERFSGAHEASHDVHATTRIFLELFKRGDIIL